MTSLRFQAHVPAAFAATVAALALLAPAALAQASYPTSDPPPAEKSAVEIADSLLSVGDTDGSYAVLVAHLALEPDDFEARWRATRAALGNGIAAGIDKETRRTWLREADEHGRALLLGHPDEPEAMAWAAAARGRRALAEDGARTVVALAEETWEITGALLAAHPDHPLGNHVRGKLHQEVARLPRVKRVLARMFLRGNLLSEGKWELAEEHMRRAIAGDPGMIVFYLDLGETYRYQGKEEEALSTYRRGLAEADRLPIDGGFKDTMRRRIALLEGAPARP